jgi:hypothetical protein
MTDTRENEPVNEGDLSGQTTESPADDAVDSPAGESGVNWQKKYLAAKGAEEEANRLRRENQELRERTQSSPAIADAGPTVQSQREQQIIEAANNGELWAQTLLEERERIRAEQTIMARDSVTLYKLNLIPDPALREEIRTEFATNRPRYQDIEQAKTTVESRKKDAEIQRLQAALRKAEGSKPPPDTVRTVTKEVFASGTTAKEMTRAQWLERQESLSDEDRMREQRLRINGKIVVKG